MVIIASSISEVSIDEFFHNTEISVLNICHEMEMHNARYKYLNEADSDKKDSVLKKFVEMIKQKAIELFNKVYHTIQALYRNHMRSKYMELVKSRKVNIDEVDVIRKVVSNIQRRYDTNNTRLEDWFYNINGQIPISDEMKNDIITGKLKSVSDFMFKFGVSPRNITRAMMAKNNIIDFNDKEFKQEKNKFLKEIDSAYKSNEYTSEEKTEIIKRLMNFYTAILKCQISNVKFWIDGFNTLASEKEYENKMNAQIDSNYDEYFESFKKAVIFSDFSKATELLLGVLKPDNYFKKEADKCYNFVDQYPAHIGFWEVGGKYNNPKNFKLPESKWDEYHLSNIMNIFMYHRTRELYQYIYKVAETLHKYKNL